MASGLLVLAQMRYGAPLWLAAEIVSKRIRRPQPRCSGRQLSRREEALESQCQDAFVSSVEDSFSVDLSIILGP